jgi:CubicO group peptidase (beta-lactamase class C family)
MRLIVVAVLAWLWPVLAMAAPTPEAITGLVERHLGRGGVPGAQVMVVQSGRALYGKAFGGCGLGGAMTLDRPMPVGDLVHPMTAAAALKLDATGRLDLDAPTRQDPLRPGQTPRDFLNAPAAAPGALGSALAQAAGRAPAVILAEELFRPLGMAAAGAVDGRIGGCGHQPAFGVGFPRPETDPAGVAASAEDLARFAWSLNAARSHQGLTPNVLWDGPDGWSNGWRRSHWNGEPVFWREGRTRGFSSVVAILPQRELSVVVMTNQGPGLRQDPTLGLVRALVAQQQGLKPRAPEFPWERLLRFVLLVAVLVVVVRTADLTWEAREQGRRPGPLGLFGALAFLGAPWALAWALAAQLGVDLGRVWDLAPDVPAALVLLCLSGAALSLFGRPLRRRAARPLRQPLTLEGVSV